ncbi:MAG: HAMP domain-containing protein [Alphaproteobacteria bacterium]|nr:MAG: HAMP domain-containing protein [Alphaproteobacteria bacterium]
MDNKTPQTSIVPEGPGKDARRGAAKPRVRTRQRAEEIGAMFAPISNRLPIPSQLAVYIITLNVFALIGAVSFILWVDDSRDELIEVRIESLIAEAEIIADALGESAVLRDDEAFIDPEKAQANLRRVISHTSARARLFSDSGRLVVDTRLFEQVEVEDLLPIGVEQEARRWQDIFYGWLERTFFNESLPLYKERANQSGLDYVEVQSALEGNVASARRVAENGTLVVSVGVPVRKYKIVLGALLVSAEGGDIEAMVRENRMTTLFILIAGIGISGFLSLALSLYIARPLRTLARTADEAITGTNFARVEIPELRRPDEIGDLSRSLRRMVAALYNRIEAIESFAADVSHEIKNPLTSIRSAVETISYVKDDKSRQTLLDLIARDVGRLDRLVTDISNASRLDAELARETSHVLDMKEVLETITSIYRDTHKPDQPTVRFATRSRPGEHENFLVRGLEGRLGQVFRNLIDNAISFSKPEDHIDVVLRKRHVKGIEEVWVTVEDQGPGIPPDNLETIFNRFYTERPGEENFGRNSGLGLSISRQIVEAHDGKIWAENIEDPQSGDIKGARFVVAFRAALAERINT